MDVRRFSRAVTTMKCTKKRDARAVSRFYDDPVIVAVVLACAIEETKPLIWLSPSANQRGNPCSGSHLLTRICFTHLSLKLKNSTIWMSL